MGLLPNGRFVILSMSKCWTSLAVTRNIKRIARLLFSTKTYMGEGSASRALPCATALRTAVRESASSQVHRVHALGDEQTGADAMNRLFYFSRERIEVGRLLPRYR
jgi:hypothetical protein